MATVEQFMLREFPLIDKDETLEAAWDLVERKGVDKIVTYENDKIAGIVASRDIALKLGTERTRLTVPSRLHISSFMSTDVKTVEPSVSIVDAARILLETKVSIGGFEATIGALPVVKKGEILGLFTKWEVAKFVVEEAVPTPVSNVMRVEPYALKWSDKLVNARHLMAKNDTSFIPVVDEDGRPVGYLTIYEVAYAFMRFYKIVPEKYRKERLQHLLVHDVMRLRPPRVEPNTPLAEAARLILEKRSRGAIVVQEDRIVGILTLDDIVKYIAYTYQQR